MSAGIMLHDKGYCGRVSSVWHKMPQYKCIPERDITIMELLEVADYPLEKQQLYRGNNIPVDAWSIVRTDKDVTLVPSVGDRFTLVDNKHMVNVLNENLMSLFPDLIVDSCGTLWNGATFFLNLGISEFTVKGDKSPTETNIMYVNPMGKGSYICGVNSTRICCANTLRIAETQAVANASIKKFRHTSSVSQKINDHMVDMAELKLQLKRYEEKMNFLSDCSMDTAAVDAFLNKMFPAVNDDKEGRSKTIALNSKTAILNIFEGVQTQTLAVPFSKYGMIQSITDWVDHEKTSRNSDIGATTFDGLFGIRATKKDEFLDALMAA